jgi:hypothetical protein
MMCAIMNKLRRISAAARHRPVFDLRIPALLYPGSLTPAEIRRGIGPCFFSSRLTQPLFTKLTNLRQKRTRASEEARDRHCRQWRASFASLLESLPVFIPLGRRRGLLQTIKTRMRFAGAHCITSGSMPISRHKLQTPRSTSSKQDRLCR